MKSPLFFAVYLLISILNSCHVQSLAFNTSSVTSTSAIGNVPATTTPAITQPSPLVTFAPSIIRQSGDEVVVVVQGRGFGSHILEWPVGTGYVKQTFKEGYLVTLHNFAPYGASTQIYEIEVPIDPATYNHLETFTVDPGSVLQYPVAASNLLGYTLTFVRPTQRTTVTANVITYGYIGYDGDVRIYPASASSTSTFTVDTGRTLLVSIVTAFEAYSVTTLTGPTTVTLTAKVPYGVADFMHYLFETFDATDPFCASAKAKVRVEADFTRTILRKSPIATLGAGTTITTSLYEGNKYVTHVFSGPSTVYYTTVQQVAPGILPIGGSDRCGGYCGYCFIHFPLAYVYYWPVESPNTACLTPDNKIDDGLAIKNSTGGDVGVKLMPRALNQELSAGVTTVVRNGRTFTSPSIYIEFPTVSAADLCGNIGSVYTSVVLSLPPEEVSTCVYSNDPIIVEGYTLPCQRFDFKDALCPPTSLASVNLWTVIGLGGGYNPILSPPAEITQLDKAWSKSCQGAEFQANDPPFALLPYANLEPNPTPVAPVVAATPATPKSGPPAVPVQTGPGVLQLVPTKAAMVDPQKTDVPAVAVPVVNVPSSPTPVAGDPKGSGAKDPVVNDPGAKDPAAKEPEISGAGGVGLLGLKDPAAKDPAAKSPGAQDPTVKDPGTNNPGTNNPGMNNPGMNNPGTNNPGTNSPGANDPGTNNPGTNNPGANDAGTNNPGTNNPGTNNPGANDPGTNSPGTNNPAAKDPGANNPDSAILNPQPNPPPAKITVGGQTYTASADSNFVINSQTYTPGATVTIAGSAVTIPEPPRPTPVPALLTFAGQTYTANTASAFIIGGQTLLPGGPAITVSDVPLSLVSSGNAIVRNGITSPLAPQPTLNPPDVFTFAGQIFTANSNSAFIVAGQTLVPGGSAITVDGHPISVAPLGSSYVVADGTITIPVIARPPQATLEVLTYGGRTYTADSASVFLIDGQTLRPGAVVTVAGTPISYVAGGEVEEVVVGSTSTQLLGGLIVGGLNNGSGAGAGAGAGGEGSGVPFAGGASGKGGIWREGLMGWVGVMGAALMMGLWEI